MCPIKIVATGILIGKMLGTIGKYPTTLCPLLLVASSEADTGSK